MPNNSGEQHGLNLLSFDAGGITGLSSLLILKEIMTKVKEKDRGDTVPKPCELFDMIAGTGTGAISAVMLGRLRMDIDEAIRNYTRLMKTVFSERKRTLKGDTSAFKASVLERELMKLIGSAVGDEDEKMVEEEQSSEETRCKVVVYAMAYNPTPALPIAFRSYPSATAATRCTIWEALRATTAHPQMFKSIQVDVEGTGSPSIFTHGGLGCTNPTPRLLKEAKQIYPGQGVRSITSIGTGHPRTIQITTGRWCASWRVGESMMRKVMQAAREMTEGSERVAEEMAQRFYEDGPLYYRPNIQKLAQRANASGWERPDKITAHTRVYLDQAEVRSKIDRLAEVSTRPLKRLISHLPSDILILIFNLVFRLSSCQSTLHSSSSLVNHAWRLNIQRAPVILSQVCSHWRRTAIDTPTLWSHIDIQPCFLQPEFARAATRWDVYVQRSGSCLLDIHITDRPCSWCFHNTSPPRFDAHLDHLIQKIAPRTRHLAVRCISHIDARDFARRTISSFLGSCVPGVLNVLDLRLYPLQISANARDRFPDELPPVELPEYKPRFLFRSIIVLGLHGNYPRLGNKDACRGLVELRLCPKGLFIPIEEPILVNIIKSNPRLRVFEFDMQVTNMLPENGSVTPVHVDDLQIVILGQELWNYPGKILRWLHPGLKPLSLSMHTPYELSGQDPAFTAQHEIRGFIARSNVTKLGLRRTDTYAQLDNMLTMAPNVKVLAVQDISPIPAHAHLLSKPLHSLDALYVIPLYHAGSLNEKNIQWFARYYDVRELTIWTEDLKVGTNSDFGTKVTIGDVHARHPVAKTISEELNPVADWY